MKSRSERRRVTVASISTAATLAVLGLAFGAANPAQVAKPRFSSGQRFACFREANWPGSYRTERLRQRVSITPRASLWFDGYKRFASGERSGSFFRNPYKTQDPLWEDWIRQKLLLDWRNAAPSTGDSETKVSLRPIPTDLAAAVGAPPPFAEIVSPTRHVIRVRGDYVALTDHAWVGRRFRYYRFAHGVQEAGKALKTWREEDLGNLLYAGGLSCSEARIFLAVSLLEGGFDSINTYDTGYISAGFLQFSSGRTGNGALMEVLQEERREAPEDYRHDFTEQGIDVDEENVLHVVDPATGFELEGAAAVRCVIREPRLAAVFVRAGRASRAFQEAQIRTARQRFFPAMDPLTVRLGDGTLLKGRVCDVVRSEAGMATLLDGKINTGALSALFQTSVQAAVVKHHLSDWDAIARWEKEIIALSQNRVSFLGYGKLSQPASVPHPQQKRKISP